MPITQKKSAIIVRDTDGSLLRILPETEARCISHGNTTVSAELDALNTLTDEMKDKLDGIDSGANAYVLPNATDSTAGGVIVGGNISVSNGTISIPDADTSGTKGVVDLSSAVNSSSETQAATSKAVKDAYDLANGKQDPATTLSGYGILDAYTKSEIDAKMTSAMHYKGSVSRVENLPSSNNAVGDFYNVTGTGENYAWTGSEWDLTGSIVTFEALTAAEIDAMMDEEESEP